MSPEDIAEIIYVGTNNDDRVQAVDFLMLGLSETHGNMDVEVDGETWRIAITRRVM